MAVLYIKDADGNKIAIPSIKGADGIGIKKSEINTDGELVLTYSNGETANLGKVVGSGGANSSVQSVSGEVAIEDLPLGLSYAAKDTQLKYLSNAEESIHSTLSVATGSCIIKTLGQIADSATGEILDGAITVYVIPRYHVLYDEYGNQNDLLMKKITPYHDMYGLQYNSEEIKNDITVVSEIPNGIYDDTINTKQVPSVGAVIDYVASVLPTDVSEVGM